MPANNGGGWEINTDKPSRLYLAGQEVQGWSENCQNRGQLRSCRRNKLEQEEEREGCSGGAGRLGMKWTVCLSALWSIWANTPDLCALSGAQLPPGHCFEVDFLFLCSCAWVNGKKMLLECLWSGCNCRLRLEIVFMWIHDGGVIDEHLESKRCFQLGDIMGTVGNFMAGWFFVGNRSADHVVWWCVSSQSYQVSQLWAQGNKWIYTRWDDSMRRETSLWWSLIWKPLFELHCSQLLWVLALLQQRNLFPSLLLVKHFILCQGWEFLKCTRFSSMGKSLLSESPFSWLN